jgi:hypothetical protein
VREHWRVESQVWGGLELAASKKNGNDGDSGSMGREGGNVKLARSMSEVEGKLGEKGGEKETIRMLSERIELM